MHRLLVESHELSQESPALSRDALHHLKVLRPKDGEEIELFDGKGSLRRYLFDAAARGLRAAPGQTIRTVGQSNKSLTLFACVTKGSRWDWTIEKAVELGVSRIVPVISDRCIVRLAADEREAKAERWRRIAEDAARQSDAVCRLPARPRAGEGDGPRLRRRAHESAAAPAAGGRRPISRADARTRGQLLPRPLRGSRGRLHAGGARVAAGDRDAGLVRPHDPARRDGGDLRAFGSRRDAALISEASCLTVGLFDTPPSSRGRARGTTSRIVVAVQSAATPFAILYPKLSTPKENP